MTSKSKKPVDLDDYLPDAATLDRMAEPVIYNKDVDPKLLDRLKNFATNPELKSVTLATGGEPPIVAARAASDAEKSPAMPPAVAVIEPPPVVAVMATPAVRRSAGSSAPSASSASSAPTVQSLQRPVQRRRRELFATLTLLGAVGVLVGVGFTASRATPDSRTSTPASGVAPSPSVSVAAQPPAAPTVLTPVVLAPASVAPSAPSSPALPPTALPSADPPAVAQPSVHPSSRPAPSRLTPPLPSAPTPPVPVVPPAAVTAPTVDRPAPAGDKL